jgi:diguanylate cyclase (GGDEF)-like protein/PAS domain S-box-containing protein
MVCDADGLIVHANRAFSAITGYAPEEVAGKAPSQTFWDQDDALGMEIDTALATRGHWRGEGRARRKDGAAYVESRSISVARDHAGRVVSRVVVFSDVTHEKEDQRRLAFLAHHDALTGLPNRALFMRECKDAIARAQRHRTRVALLYIDLDDFKEVNDSCGHAAGDLLLQAVGPRVQECVRKTDMVARLGGDEFTVLIDDVQDPRDVAVIARKVLECLSEPFSVGGNDVRVAASMGIACFPDDASDVDTLLAGADTAMYAAKELGRNNCQYFSTDLNARALEAMIVANNLRQASARDEFCLVYQPRAELGGLGITAVEALVRWNHPELGMILPSQFISVAEKTGLIEELGSWVLRTACREMAAWRRAGIAPPRVAINLSSRQFRDPALVTKIAAALADCGLDGDALEVEVTESALMDEPRQAVATLRKIRALGVSVAIDDFGTGYSSINHLQRFEVDRIKIDQSFVRGILGAVDEVRITEAIIAVARTMRVRLVAEGIETPQQLEYLRGTGCEEGQGHLFSKPVNPMELAGLLGAGRLPGPRIAPVRTAPSVSTN